LGMDVLDESLPAWIAASCSVDAMRTSGNHTGAAVAYGLLCRKRCVRSVTSHFSRGEYEVPSAVSAAVAYTDSIVGATGKLVTMREVRVIYGCWYRTFGGNMYQCLWV
jgi:hypothetical protein